MRRTRKIVIALSAAIWAMAALAASVEAQDISCSAEAAIDSKRMVTLSDQQLLSWATVPLTTGGTLADEMKAYGLQLSDFTTGTEVPLTLPGKVASSVYVLESQSARDPMAHTWVILYSVAPTAVRVALEQEGVKYPWSGFVLTLDGNNVAAPIRLGMLGQPSNQLVYDPQARTFHNAETPLAGAAQAKISQDCIQCIIDLVKSVACEAVADGISCATVAACPGAILSALLRATWKLLTQDLCFPGDIAKCAASCAFPQITLTPSSNAQLSSGRQQITVSISGTNAGAWALPIQQGSLPGAPLIKIGSNPRVLDWNPTNGTYTIYAGNIPLVNTPGIARSTNVNVGVSSATGSVSWTISDSCNDNRGLRFRIFDKTRGGVFPSTSTYYAVPAGGQVIASFNAPRGSRICLGASQDPPGSTWWCYGINGDRDGSYSSLCCAVVPASGNLTAGNNLVCN